MKKLLVLLVIIFLFSCEETKKDVEYNPTPYEFKQEIPLRDFPLYIPDDNKLTVEGVKLGKKLFNEKKLSSDLKLACTSCHHEDKAFTNNEVFAKGHNGIFMKHNTMPLFNLVFNKSFGWTGAASNLEKAIIHTIELPEEFNENWDNVIIKLKDAGYSKMFFDAFGTEQITADLTAKAIAQFLRSNISVNSKFDRMYYFNDERYRFNIQESKGYELFLSESGDCFHCHRVGPFFDNRFHNNGLDKNPSEGRQEVTGDEFDKGKYKTPTLRNIALTAPYMHDGRFKTLKEVLDFYSDGVNYSPTLDPNMNHMGGITLNEEEKLAVIAFLNTLTDLKYVE